MSKDIYEHARITIEKKLKKDKINMPHIFQKFTQDEQIFINELYKRYKYDPNDLIFHEVCGHINFKYKNMQIGRIRLNTKKRRMQILTFYTVVWFENISLEAALNKIDDWLIYLDELDKSE